MSDVFSQSRASLLVKGFESAALRASVFIRAHPGNPWFKIHRTTRFHSSLAFLKLISRPRSSPVIAK
jgi:hypothetical protein